MKINSVSQLILHFFLFGRNKENSAVSALTDTSPSRNASITHGSRSSVGGEAVSLRPLSISPLPSQFFGACGGG